MISIQNLYQQGGATLIIIVVLSVVALAVALERLVFLWLFKQRLRQSGARILDHLREDKPALARAVVAAAPEHPATDLFQRLLGDASPKASVVKRDLSRILREGRKRLWVLGSIGATAPFVGLFGTVLGIMEAFHQIGAQGQGGIEVVSAGISEALITTAGGIFVAVEAVLFFNYLQVAVADCLAELRELVADIAEFREETPDGNAGH